MQPSDGSRPSAHSSSSPADDAARLLAEAMGNDPSSVSTEEWFAYATQVIWACFEAAQQGGVSDPDVRTVVKLTDRQREVLNMLAAGMKPRTVAATLHISVHTVRSHVYGACKAVGVHSYEDAIKARMEGIVI